jgi:hypothetical protein
MYILMYAMVNTIENVFNSFNKFYMAGLMTAAMVPIEIFLMRSMYLWRFAIEHLFRFLKQHMGLNCNHSSNLARLQRWMWIVALAYW